MASERNSDQLVSVIIPTRNRLELLRETLQSLSDQSRHSWEAVVVDDGSDDGTEEYMQRLCASDAKFRYFQRKGPSSGACVCRNQGVQKAKGDFLIFLDSDDLLMPECIEQRLAFIQRNLDLDFCVYQGEAFGEGTGGQNRPFSAFSLSGDLDRFLFHDLPWEITSPIWRRTSFERLGGFDERLPSWQDVELHIRAIISGMRYVSVSQTDHFIRWQNDPEKISLQQRTDENHLYAGSGMLLQIRQRLHEAGLLNWTRLRALAGWHFLIAERFMRNRQFGRALRSWSVAYRDKNVGRSLFLQGVVILTCQFFFGAYLESIRNRLTNKWMGIVRFREQPKLLSKSMQFSARRKLRLTKSHTLVQRSI